MANTWKYDALLVRAKNAHCEDESMHIRLKANAWAIEEIEQLRTKCLRELKELSNLQKWLADQLEEDLLAIEKEEKG